METTVTNDQLEVMKKELAESLKEGIATWADFYEKLRGMMRDYSKCQCRGHMMDALYTNYAFIVAMEELPEEGDILVILDRVAEIMTYGAETKLFAVIATAQPSMPSAVMRAILSSGLSRVEEEVAEGVVKEVRQDKKHLH